MGLPPLVMITPGFPLLLAPLSLLFGDAFAWHRAALAFAQAGLPWALWAHFRRVLEPRAALALSLLASTSPLVLSQAGTVMSETPYLLLTLLLLRALEPRASPSRAGWLTLLLTQVRPAGLSLLPAVLLPALRQRRAKDLARLALPAAAGGLAWSAWSWAVSGSVQELDEWRLSYAGLGALRPLAVAADNARFYLVSLGSAHLPRAWGGGGAGLLLGAGLAALAARGLALRLRKDPGDRQSWLLLGGAAMHAVWAWQYERYLIPLLPWLFWAAALGAGGWGGRLLAGLLAAQTLFHAPAWALGPSPWAEPELSRTYAWVRSRSAPEDALASALHVRDGYHCSRPSLPLPDEDEPERFARRIKDSRARLVLWQGRLDLGLSAKERSTLLARLERAGRSLSDPRLFRLVHEEPDEDSKVYAPR